MEKTLVHVYKPGKFGFADFIRAIPVLKQLADECNYTYKVCMNHPMSAFLDVDTTPTPQTFYENSRAHLKEILESSGGQVAIESNMASGTISFPRGMLSSFIKPSSELMTAIKEKMRTLGLKEREFVVFHVRCGDADFAASSAETPEYANLVRRLNSYLQIIRVTNPCPILLLSSSDDIIKEFTGKSRMVTTGLKRCHTAEAEDLDALRDTLIEFYLMSFAKKIYSASGTGFGVGSSGFSYWLARAFNIPRTHFDADI